MNVKRHTSRLKSFLWYTSVSLLVLLAVLLSLVRLLLPAMETYRQDVAARVSQVVGQPVRITSLDARLLGVSPSLILEEVTLLDPVGEWPIARFREIHLALDLFQSIWMGQPILKELTVVGANLGLTRDTDGKFQIQGLTLKERGQSDGGGASIGEWLFRQGKLAILDSQLTWDDRLSDQLLVFSDVEIHLQNRGDTHRLELQVKRPGRVRQALHLSAFFHGNIRDQASWRGDIYLKADKLQPVEWLRQFRFPDFRLDSAEVDLELWGRWDRLALQDLQGRVALNDMAMQYRDEAFALKQMAASLAWQRRADGWQSQIDDLRLRYAGMTWAPLRLALRQQNRQQQVMLDGIDLTSAANLARDIPQLDTKVRELLARLNPRGRLANVRVDIDDEGELTVQAGVERLGIDEWEKIPGVEGVSGKLWWGPAGADIQLDSTAVTLNLLRLFRNPINVDHLSGHLTLQPDSTGWYLFGRELAVSNPDLEAELSLDVNLPQGEKPFIDLRGTFRNGNGRSAPRYFPAKIMKENLVEWLDQAFVEGEVVQGSLLYHGRTSDFPFTENNGRFQIAFEGKGVELSYFKGWPHLTDVHADVLFEGRGMRIQARSGKVLGSEVRSAEVAIKDFKHARLAIEAEAELNGDDALALLRDTPLAQMGGSVVAGMRLEGASHLQLGLDIPLSAKLQAERPLQSQGVVTFKGNHLQLEQGINIGDLKGDVRFSNQNFSAEGIEATMFGAPVRLQVATSNGAVPVTELSAVGHARAQELVKQLDWHNLNRLDGVAPWQATLTIQHGKGGESVLKVQSNLQGLAVNLPSGMGKVAGDESGLSVAIYLSGKRQGEFSVDYADRISAVVARDPAHGYAMRKAAFHFGGGRASLPTLPALRVTGQLEGVKPREWMPLFGGDNNGMETLPVDLIMKRLQLLPQDDSSDKGKAFDFEKLPSLTVAIDSFAYGAVELGKLRFSAPRQTGFRELSAISIENPHMVLKGSGEWQRIGANSFTRLNLELASNNVGKMLRTLEFRTVIESGEGKAQGHLSWPGTPLDFKLARLGGDINLKIEKGVLAEVDPGAGRLLGLFSLYELPRRLSLDFADLFKQGLEFSLMEADFQIRDGDAYTENFHTVTPSAALLTTGRTGLAKRDFDQQMVVIPDVSGTLPLAGGLAWGPQVGAALLILQQLFKPGIEEATMSRYQISGNWDAPNIVKIQPAQGERTP